ncbi:uncharacterized protein KQ657_005216 [Scheffersomyces spartinae]|uniref:Uncharacterized protein n=1 Tax=Scheffersomyces spartinae TaxID=45513 RepID=A0A9P7V9Z4_9ASCO|nr:uncharacterized protein KQ657_005216 [Scheffersomyces spartinae]KAG7194017.1 hypothetical protein KQ657_005216 [Scheffersomyces spartinae]
MNDTVVDSVWWQLNDLYHPVTTEHLVDFVEILETTIGASHGFLSSDPTIISRISRHSGVDGLLVVLDKGEMVRIMCDDILREIKIVDPSNSIVYGSFENDNTDVYVDTEGDIMAKSIVLYENTDHTDHKDPHIDEHSTDRNSDGHHADLDSVISKGLSPGFDSVPASPSSVWSSVSILESIGKTPSGVLPEMMKDLKLHHEKNMAQYKDLEHELDKLTDQNVHDWYRLRQLHSNNDSLMYRINNIRQELVQIGSQLQNVDRQTVTTKPTSITKGALMILLVCIVLHWIDKT